MKKTLLIAAAALAAGVISSQAQAVYSQNIVGYVNTVFPAGFKPVVNPLNLDGTNAATSVLANVPDLSDLYYWNGSSYVHYIVYQGAYYDQNQNPTTAPNLNVGGGFFINATASFTNTFVGTVVGAGGPSGTIITNNINMVQGFNFVNSIVPIAGGLTTTLQMSPPDLSDVYTWNGTGWVHTIFYQGSYYDQNQNPTTEPQISVGSAIFVNSTAPFTWSMTYTNQ